MAVSEAEQSYDSDEQHESSFLCFLTGVWWATTVSRVSLLECYVNHSTRTRRALLWKEWLLHRSSLSLQRCPCSMWQRPLPVKLAPSRARRIMPRPLPSFRHVERHSKFASQSRTNLQAASSSSKSKLHTSPTQLLPTARAAPSLRRRTVASRAHNLLAAVLQLATLLQLSTNAANLNKHMVAVFPDVHNSRVSTHGGPDQHHLQLHPKFLTRKSRSLRAALFFSPSLFFPYGTS